MRDLMPRFLAAVTLLALASLPAAAQVISLSPQQYDFGVMNQHETRTTFFTITNDGGGLLTIDNVVASCGCTVPKVTKNELAPGESTQIEVEFNSKVFVGEQIKTVTVHSNDTRNPEAVFMIRAEVHTPLKVDPANMRLGFGRTTTGNALVDTVTFEATEIDDLDISTEGTRGGVFRVRVIDNLGGDPRRAGLEVTQPADAPFGQFRDNVRVATNVAAYPTVDIELKGWVDSAVKATPDNVNFRFSPKFVQTIRVRTDVQGKKFHVTGADVDLPEISVRVDETVSGTETLIHLTGAPIAKTDERAVAANGRISGALTIRTDEPTVPEIVVPIRYLVRM